MANRLLPKDSPHLRCSVCADASASGSFTPVYLVGERNLTPGDLAFVTPSCEAVILQNPPFAAWVTSLSDSDGPAVDPVAMTAFVLLHELGHLRRHDCGRNLISDSQAAFNNDANGDKEAEFAADAVAVGILKSATDGHDLDAKVAASRIEMALATASFYVAARRIVASPGADLLGTPSVFWDLGFSHPNFEWRLLKVNAPLNPSETSRRLLSDFESGRTRAARPVFVAPKP